MLPSHSVALAALASASLAMPWFPPEPEEEVPMPTPRAAPDHKLFLQEIAFSRDGRFFAFSRYEGAGPYDGRRWTVWIADRDGSHPRVALRGAVGASFSPDGERIATSRTVDGDEEIVTARLDGSDLVRVTRRPGRDTSPAYSPDGRWLVYDAEVDGNLDVYRIDVEGKTGPHRLTSDPARDYNPVVSPDGRSVVFYRETGDNQDQIWTLDLATGREVRITDGTGHSFYPTYLPDGRIAFSGKRPGGQRRLYVTSADGKRQEPVGPDGVFYARFSPDGKEALYLIERGKGEILRMAADGSDSALRLDAAAMATGAAALKEP